MKRETPVCPRRACKPLLQPKGSSESSKILHLIPFGWTRFSPLEPSMGLSFRASESKQTLSRLLLRTKKLPVALYAARPVERRFYGEY